jgi:hypothetical protein
MLRYKGRKYLGTFPSPRVRDMVAFVNSPEGTFTHPRTEAFRKELLPHLIEVARGRPLSEQARAELLVRARTVSITPHELADGPYPLRYQFKGKTPAIYAYDTLQLDRLRQATPRIFPGDLRQCAQCGALFFDSDLPKASAKGPARAYHSEECRAKAYSGTSTARVRKFRAKRAAKAAAKHK